MEYKEQVQQLDCGLFVLQMMHKYYYDNWISIPTLKSNANFDNNGLNTLELNNLSQKFGMNLEIFEGEFELLLNLEINNPIISIIKNENFFHYVVIEKIKNEHIIFYDPIYGKRRIKLNEFKKIYSNIIIVCHKTTYKASKDNRKIVLFKNLFIKETILISLISISIVILTFISTFYLKIIIDQVIPTKINEKLISLTIFFIFLFIFKSLLLALQNWLINKIELKYNITLLDKYIEKIANVEWKKIHYIDESMHLKNIELLSAISTFQATFFFTIINQAFSLIFSTLILIILDFNIFLISLLFTCLTILITVFFKKKMVFIEKKKITNSIRMQKSFFNIILGIPEFKIGKEQNFLLKTFNQNLEKNIKTQVKAHTIDLLYNLINLLIKNLIPFVVVILAVFKIWNNNLSIGELMLFMSIFSFFIEPLSMFTLMIINIPITKQYVETINSFFILDDEEKNLGGYLCQKIESIKIENLKFSFIEGKQILKIPFLEINKNSHIVGKNGSGKSTLLKLISTLIKTENISFNCKLIDYYNLVNLRNQICYISNDQYMASGTIYQYLTNENKENVNELLNSIEEYNLLYFFEKLNLNLHDYVEEFGKNISSGQKQFIHLLKLFSSNYSLILLDEAFENLDNEILEEFQNILRKRLNKQIVVEISHRKTYLFNGGEINCELFK